MNDAPLLSFGTEVWRGGVNSWECDEMGHMNTRFYVARCMEATSVLFAYAGIAGAIVHSHITIKEMHIRFHREAHAANSLHITGGFANVGDSEADLVFLLHHSFTGALAASFRVRVAHIDEQQQPQDWPAAFRDKATEFAVDTPKEAQVRSTGTETVSPVAPDLSAHTRIMLGAPTGNDCDLQGRMLPQKFIGAASDGIRRLTAPLREIVAANAEVVPTNIGGAVLEFRIVHFAAPKLGDCIEIRSAFKGCDSRVMRLEHWMTDAVTGACLGFQEVVAIVFDIDARKIVGITDAAKEKLEPLMVR